MAESMIERVARVLAEKDGVHPDWSATGMGMPGPEDNEPGWKLYEEEARAAIEAMREPTDAMVVAGRDETDWEPKARAVWSSMIDAALEGLPDDAERAE